MTPPQTIDIPVPEGGTVHLTITVTVAVKIGKITNLPTIVNVAPGQTWTSPAFACLDTNGAAMTTPPDSAFTVTNDKPGTMTVAVVGSALVVKGIAVGSVAFSLDA